MSVRWVSFLLSTGDIIGDLPSFVPDDTLRDTIGAVNTAAGKLYLDDAPANWPLATLEGGALLARYDDADPMGRFQWGGYVVEAVDNLSATEAGYVDLALATLEGYLDRRTCGDYTASGRGQNNIVTDLVTQFAAAPAGGIPGVPFVVRQVTPGGGAPRDRTYAAVDNVSVLQRLQQLSAVDGGPEWRIILEWSADRKRVVPVLLVGDRIGNVATGPSAAVTFEPGMFTSLKRTRSYADGKGANAVVAYSSGQGDTTPQSDPIYTPDGVRPVFNFRWSPSTSITDKGTLDSYARRASAMLDTGAVTWAFTVSTDTPYRYGRDWDLGDDLGWNIPPGDPAIPNGAAGRGRALAVEFSDVDVTPILAETPIPTDGSEAAA